MYIITTTSFNKSQYVGDYVEHHGDKATLVTILNSIMSQLYCKTVTVTKRGHSVTFTRAHVGDSVFTH